MKTAQKFVCQSCQAPHPKWAGQCSQCRAWNSLEAMSQAPVSKVQASPPQRLSDVNVSKWPRMPTALGEFDRVLGGGLVPGAVVLLGGDPGVGKSTLLLQALGQLSQKHRILYVTGEESLEQVAARAQRLNVPLEDTWVMAETDCQAILAEARVHRTEIMVLDSVQTLGISDVAGGPGSVSQVRAVTHACVQFAKQHNTAIFLVGHVTKDGALAGPRMLEHMVDTVLYFEGEKDRTYRMVRAVKNRFGAVNEMGVFAMLDRGLKPVSHPSALFLSHTEQPTPGRVIMVTWEGTRPLLVEVQALVDDSQGSQPRRVMVGLESQRVAMLLAVLSRHVGLSTAGQDVFINVVGGLRVLEPAADLAILAAVMSSVRNQALNPSTVVFGEVGLGGELRPVPSGQARLAAAVQHGLKHAWIPAANQPKPKDLRAEGLSGCQCHAFHTVDALLNQLFI
jgi:DNA repair protein RadA/Sms